MIQIHEDDVGMRTLYPIAALPSVLVDMEAACDSAERNQAPGGVGWTDIYLMQEPDLTYRDLELSAGEIGATLGRHLPRIPVFQVGQGTSDPFGSFEGEAHCYGFGRKLFVKLEVADDLVTHIWFDVHGRGSDPAPLRPAFEAIHALAPSMLADYWLDAAGDLGDPAFLTRYLDAARDVLA